MKALRVLKRHEKKYIVIERDPGDVFPLGPLTLNVDAMIAYLNG